MVEVQRGPLSLATNIKPLSDTISRLRNHLVLDTFSPVNQNGSFEFDRVIKCGYVQKRTQKTKTWKTIYLVLRPNALSIYKSDKEDKLRHKVYLSDLTAVTLLKDPKHKRDNIFGLFSPAKNFHFQAPTLKDAQEWVDIIRRDARIEEEEEEMFLASPIVRRESYMGGPVRDVRGTNQPLSDNERLASSSPEPTEPIPILSSPSGRRTSQQDYSGLSGNELASDMSDNDGQQRVLGASIESLAVQLPPAIAQDRPGLGGRNASQLSNLNIEQDPDRVMWQGRMWFLRSKGGVKQWKDSWAVLRPRNLILYKDESEYMATFVLPLGSVVNVVDLDPISRTKTHCMQIITEEKSYRFCAHDEETLVQCLGAFKSLLAKRKELAQKMAVAAAANGKGTAA
ncbi:PH domain-containing protein [Thozetella sp. PMI_491]|nr:PH domain-containing protein [Thozetella sp. PMI_491]